jgi:ankyrin repeat protein
MGLATSRLEKSLLNASKNGDWRAIETILDRGVDIETQNLFGQTPLILCALHGNIKAAKILIDRGADINAQDDHGRSPLIWVSGRSTSSSTEILRVLLSSGADRSLADKMNSHRAIHNALRNKSTLNLRILLEDGEDSYGSMPDGQSYDEFCRDKPECLAVLEAHRNLILIEGVIRNSESKAIASVSSVSSASP